MDATFHFRQKIGAAALFRSSVFAKALDAALAHHPWFCASSQHEAQIVWSDRPVLPSFPTQRILYVGDVGEEHDKPILNEALCIPSAPARALAALLKPIQECVGICALHITGLFPPDEGCVVIPSMALFYQTIVVREEVLAQPLARELARLLGPSCKAWLTASMQLTCLYAPILQGPFLTLYVQTERPIQRAELMSQWMAPSFLPSTPSSLPLYSTPTDLSQQEPFIVYQEAMDAPYVRMQRESCLIGQVHIQDNQLRLCVVPPDPVLSLLACSEALVVAGAIYW